MKTTCKKCGSVYFTPLYPDMEAMCDDCPNCKILDELSDNLKNLLR